MRTFALAGVVLVLPYYGAETFALHAIGRGAAAGDPSVLPLVDEVRDGAVAMSMFGVGLVCLAVAAVLAAVAWRRARGWAAWPLAVLVVAFPAQFFLPAPGRMAYGLLYALAAAVLIVDVARASRLGDGILGESSRVARAREVTSAADFDQAATKI